MSEQLHSPVPHKDPGGGGRGGDYMEGSQRSGTRPITVPGHRASSVMLDPQSMASPDAKSGTTASPSPPTPTPSPLASSFFVGHSPISAEEAMGIVDPSGNDTGHATPPLHSPQRPSVPSEPTSEWAPLTLHQEKMRRIVSQRQLLARAARESTQQPHGSGRRKSSRSLRSLVEGPSGSQQLSAGASTSHLAPQQGALHTVVAAGGELASRVEGEPSRAYSPKIDAMPKSQPAIHHQLQLQRRVEANKAMATAAAAAAAGVRSQLSGGPTIEMSREEVQASSALRTRGHPEGASHPPPGNAPGLGKIARRRSSQKADGRPQKAVVDITRDTSTTPQQPASTAHLPPFKQLPPQQQQQQQQGSSLPNPQPQLWWPQVYPYSVYQTSPLFSTTGSVPTVLAMSHGTAPPIIASTVFPPAINSPVMMRSLVSTTDGALSIASSSNTAGNGSQTQPTQTLGGSPGSGLLINNSSAAGVVQPHAGMRSPWGIGLPDRPSFLSSSPMSGAGAGQHLGLLAAWPQTYYATLPSVSQRQGGVLGMESTPSPAGSPPDTSLQMSSGSSSPGSLSKKKTAGAARQQQELSSQSTPAPGSSTPHSMTDPSAPQRPAVVNVPPTSQAMGSVILQEQQQQRQAALYLQAWQQYQLQSSLLSAPTVSAGTGSSKVSSPIKTIYSHSGGTGDLSPMRGDPEPARRPPGGGRRNPRQHIDDDEEEEEEGDAATEEGDAATEEGYSHVAPPAEEIADVSAASPAAATNRTSSSHGGAPAAQTRRSGSRHTAKASKKKKGTRSPHRHSPRHRHHRCDRHREEEERRRRRRREERKAAREQSPYGSPRGCKKKEIEDEGGNEGGDVVAGHSRRHCQKSTSQRSASGTRKQASSSAHKPSSSSRRSATEEGAAAASPPASDLWGYPALSASVHYDRPYGPVPPYPYGAAEGGELNMEWSAENGWQNTNWHQEKPPVWLWPPFEVAPAKKPKKKKSPKPQALHSYPDHAEEGGRPLYTTGSRATSAVAPSTAHASRPSAAAAAPPEATAPPSPPPPAPAPPPLLDPPSMPSNASDIGPRESSQPTPQAPSKGVVTYWFTGSQSPAVKAQKSGGGLRKTSLSNSKISSKWPVSKRGPPPVVVGDTPPKPQRTQKQSSPLLAPEKRPPPQRQQYPSDPPPLAPALHVPEHVQRYLQQQSDVNPQPQGWNPSRDEGPAPASSNAAGPPQAWQLAPSTDGGQRQRHRSSNNNMETVPSSSIFVASSQPPMLQPRYPEQPSQTHVTTSDSVRPEAIRVPPCASGVLLQQSSFMMEGLESEVQEDGFVVAGSNNAEWKSVPPPAYDPSRAHAQPYGSSSHNPQGGPSFSSSSIPTRHLQQQQYIVGPDGMAHVVPAPSGDFRPIKIRMSQAESTEVQRPSFTVATLPQGSNSYRPDGQQSVDEQEQEQRSPNVLPPARASSTQPSAPPSSLATNTNQPSDRQTATPIASSTFTPHGTQLLSDVIPPPEDLARQFSSYLERLGNHMGHHLKRWMRELQEDVQAVYQTLAQQRPPQVPSSVASSAPPTEVSPSTAPPQPLSARSNPAGTPNGEPVLSWMVQPQAPPPAPLYVVPGGEMEPERLLQKKREGAWEVERQLLRSPLAGAAAARREPEVAALLSTMQREVREFAQQSERHTVEAVKGFHEEVMRSHKMFNEAADAWEQRMRDAKRDALIGEQEEIAEQAMEEAEAAKREIVALRMQLQQEKDRQSDAQRQQLESRMVSLEAARANAESVATRAAAVAPNPGEHAPPPCEADVVRTFQERQQAQMHAMAQKLQSTLESSMAITERFMAEAKAERQLLFDFLTRQGEEARRAMEVEKRAAAEARERRVARAKEQQEKEEAAAEGREREEGRKRHEQEKREVTAAAAAKVTAQKKKRMPAPPPPPVPQVILLPSPAPVAPPPAPAPAPAPASSRPAGGAERTSGRSKRSSSGRSKKKRHHHRRRRSPPTPPPLGGTPAQPPAPPKEYGPTREELILRHLEFKSSMAKKKHEEEMARLIKESEELEGRLQEERTAQEELQLQHDRNLVRLQLEHKKELGRLEDRMREEKFRAEAEAVEAEEQAAADARARCRQQQEKLEQVEQLRDAVDAARLALGDIVKEHRDAEEVLEKEVDGLVQQQEERVRHLQNTVLPEASQQVHALQQDRQKTVEAARRSLTQLAQQRSEKAEEVDGLVRRLRRVIGECREDRAAEEQHLAEMEAAQEKELEELAARVAQPDPASLELEAEGVAARENAEDTLDELQQRRDAQKQQVELFKAECAELKRRMREAERVRRAIQRSAEWELERLNQEKGGIAEGLRHGVARVQAAMDAELRQIKAQEAEEAEGRREEKSRRQRMVAALHQQILQLQRSIQEAQQRRRREEEEEKDRSGVSFSSPSTSSSSRSSSSNSSSSGSSYSRSSRASPRRWQRRHAGSPRQRHGRSRSGGSRSASAAHKALVQEQQSATRSILTSSSRRRHSMEPTGSGRPAAPLVRLPQCQTSSSRPVSAPAPPSSRCAPAGGQLYGYVAAPVAPPPIYLAVRQPSSGNAPGPDAVLHDALLKQELAALQEDAAAMERILATLEAEGSSSSSSKTSNPP